MKGGKVTCAHGHGQKNLCKAGKKNNQPVWPVGIPKTTPQSSFVAQAEKQTIE